MRHLLCSTLLGAALALWAAAPAWAQSATRSTEATGSTAAPANTATTEPVPLGTSPAVAPLYAPTATAAAAAAAPGPFFTAPGLYGTSWGVPSFGSPRTYTVFSSPYGAGYGYGYYPYMYVPGYYGFRLYRAGHIQSGTLYGPGFYGTPSSFAPFIPITLPLRPPLGYYAPGFGAPAFYAW